MSKKGRVYQLPRATITLKNTTVPPRLATAFMNMRDYQAALRKPGLSANDTAMYKREIKNIRARIAEDSQSHYYHINIKLKEPKFLGYARSFEFELSHGDRLFEAIKMYIRESIRTFRTQHKVNTHGVNIAFHPGNGKVEFRAVMSSYGRDGISRVFFVPGQILKMYIDKNMRAVYDPKAPETGSKNKYLGVELEFCAEINEQELVVKLFKAGVHKFAQLKQDGSLRPINKEKGYELAILLKESTYKQDLKRVTDVLSEIKATATDRRCGMHVHIDMRKRNKTLVYNNLVACQYALFKIVDPSRYNNEFCQTVKSRKFPTDFKGTRQERYKAINAAAYYKYQTLEIRMHEGSVDFRQLTGWIELLIKIANYRKKLKGSISKLTILKKRFNLNHKLYQYIVDRNCYWQVNRQELREHMDQIEQAELTIRPLVQTAPQPADVRPGDAFRTATQAFLGATNELRGQWGPAQVELTPAAETLTTQMVNHIREHAERLGITEQELIDNVNAQGEGA